MAIDLPPVIPPQASTAAKIENYAAVNSAAVVEREVAGYTLRISGNKYLTEDQLDIVMNSARTPAQAVNALNQAYYRLGHLLVTLYFAQQDQLIYVHVVNGTVSKIKAPEDIAPYFEELVGDEHLTRSDFDEPRVLADIQAQRSGVDYTVSYQVDSDPRSFTMVFNPVVPENYNPSDLSVGLNNLGNRFLGRYFANLGLKHDFKNGLQASFSYDSAVTNWGENMGGDDYHGYTLQFNKPTTWGLYGLEGRYIEYAREVGLGIPQPDGETGGGGEADPGAQQQCLGLPLLCSVLGVVLPQEEPSSEGDGTVNTDEFVVRVESELSAIALTGEQILSSDVLHRLTLSQRIEHIENTIDVVDIGNLLDEPHTTAELGVKYNQVLRFVGGIPTQITAQGLVKAGLGSDSGTLATDEREGVVAIGRRSGEFVVLKPTLIGKFRVVDWATINLQFLGQFSNETQLPLQQQFFLGGSSLSAYLPGVLVGDSGTYGKFSIEGTGLSVAGFKIKPSLFVEHGQAWYEDAEGEAGNTRQIADAGFRLSLSRGDFLKTDFVAAVPVADDNVEQDYLDEMEADFFWQLRLTF